MMAPRMIDALCAHCGIRFQTINRNREVKFCTRRCCGLSRRRDRHGVAPAPVDGCEWVPVYPDRFALVDLPDAPLVNEIAWYLHEKGYAVADTNGRHIRMHRLLTSPPAGREVDHINRNRLDNRRANLRIADDSQNMCNKARPPSARRYRGVGPKRGKFSAMIGHQRRNYYIGTFLTEEEAALAYDAAARQLHGAFARINFPLPGELASD